ncbi:hypothetical protein C8Q73DRAFT_392012 [Cubamyces lactineus]|nr:hypothetical protein C8Q73DRAFT_392012 [Cubamyces lactineus]
MEGYLYQLIKTTPPASQVHASGSAMHKSGPYKSSSRRSPSVYAVGYSWAGVLREVTKLETCGHTDTRHELATREELPVQIASGHAATLTVPTEESGEVDLTTRLDDELRGGPRGGLSSVLPLLNRHYPARGDSTRYEVLPSEQHASFLTTCEHATCYTRDLSFTTAIANHNTCLLQKQSHAYRCTGARILIRCPAPYTTRRLRVCPGSEFLFSTLAWHDMCNASGWRSSLSALTSQGCDSGCSMFGI